VRQDIWDLGDEADPWGDGVILAYAQGVKAMMDLAKAQPRHGANWINQAAIHEHQGASVPGRLEDQCQHSCWYFLPWHRMYLYRFEQIIRSHLKPDVAEDWALPYWNYSDEDARRVLPPAFREEHLPGGTDPNPLFTKLRQHAPINIAGGEPLPFEAVDLKAALKPDVYMRNATGTVAGFGGGRTSPLFHHGPRGPFGPLEGTPHGAVHNQVGGAGGLMLQFFTAALDPVFWLHHANIDRLWEQWLRGVPPHSNTDDPFWLTMKFTLVDEAGDRVEMVVGDVLDIEEQLGYTYSGLPVHALAFAAAREEEASMTGDTPARLLGATEESVTLSGGAEASTRVAIDAPQQARLAAAEAPSAYYLNVEDVEGDQNPGLLYGVYVNLPEGEAPDPEGPHYAGAISFFGIESTVSDDADEKAPHRLSYVFDITDTVEELMRRDHWNPAELKVRFLPVGVGPDTSLGFDPPPVQVGRVSLFIE
jgi:tyrosinase